MSACLVWACKQYLPILCIIVTVAIRGEGLPRRAALPNVFLNFHLYL
jgi:hypothetical protein